MGNLRLTSRVRPLATGLVVLAGISGQAVAEPHEQAYGGYLLHAEVMASDALPRAALERHHLAFDSGHALLNVTVLRQGKTPPETAPVTVVASVREPSGAERPLDMHGIVANGRLSWVGEIPATASGRLQFAVTAFAEDDTAYQMDFSERPEPAITR